LLGEGVSEADKELMGAPDNAAPGPHPEGIAVDFAATATRGPEIKRVHWMFRQAMTLKRCRRTNETSPPPGFRLQGDENVTLQFGIRGLELFGDDAGSTAALRFDPIARADTDFGDGDGDVTLDELGRVRLDSLRGSGAYSAASYTTSVPQTLEDYMYLVLLPKLVRFPENVLCDPELGLGSD
jgi:hypothetical protein